MPGYEPPGRGDINETTSTGPATPAYHRLAACDMFGELAYSPRAMDRSDDVALRNAHLPMSWRRGGESAGLAARLTRDGTGIELLHAMRVRRSRRRKGDTSDLETRPGRAALPVRPPMTQVRTLTTVDEGAPTTPGTFLSGPTPLDGTALADAEPSGESRGGRVWVEEWRAE